MCSRMKGGSNHSMAARDDFFQILPVLVLVLKRPTAAPRDPEPGKIRLLEQAEHLFETRS